MFQNESAVHSIKIIASFASTDSVGYRRASTTDNPYRLAIVAYQNRWAHARNTIINFVPQQEAWVIERMGRFHKILEPVSSLEVDFLLPSF